MGVNLRPGPAAIRIAMRGRADLKGNYGYALVRLNEREMAGAYVDGESWREVMVPVKTGGGKRWLAVELLNGFEATAGPEGPGIELGPEQVVYGRTGGAES